MVDSVELGKPAPIDVAERLRKPGLEALLFADFFNQTEDGKLNLIGLFDRIYVDRETNESRPFVLFVRTIETRAGELRVTGYAPSGEPVFAVATKVDASNLDPSTPGHVQIASFVGFKLSALGTYWFEVTFNGEVLGGTALVAAHAPEE